MPVLVETDNIVIRRDSLDEVIVNIIPAWTSFLFSNEEIKLFKECVLSKSSNEEFQFQDCGNSVYIESLHWAFYMPLNVFDELKLAIELAPVDQLVPSDFKTIKMVKERQEKDKNVIYFQIESMRRKK